MQNVEAIKPGYPLFNTDGYQQAFARKRVFEEAYGKEKLEEVFHWTTTEAYKELNFQSLKKAFYQSAVLNGVIVFIIGFSGAMAKFLTLEKVLSISLSSW